MMRLTELFILLLSLSNVISAPLSLFNCKILDLTHSLKPGIPHWPGLGPAFELNSHIKGPHTINGHKHPYIEHNSITISEHFGTHVDGPSRFHPWPDMRIDDIPLDNGMGPACVFDISEKAKANKDYGLTIADINEWEAKNGPMPPRCIALVNTGWEFKWRNSEEFLGTKNISDPTSFHFPAIEADAGEYLVVQKKVKAVGVDVVSLDMPKNHQRKTGSTPFPVHYSVLGRGLLAYESLKNLHYLPPFGATVLMPPMKHDEGSGGPIRAFSVGWDGPMDPCRLVNEVSHQNKLEGSIV